MSNYKIFLEINPDKDFYYERIIPELKEYDSVILDCTPENIDLVIDQLNTAINTADAKDYLKYKEDEWKEFWNACAELYENDLIYYQTFGEWVEFDLEYLPGNQSFKCMLYDEDNSYVDDYGNINAQNAISSFMTGIPAVPLAQSVNNQIMEELVTN